MNERRIGDVRKLYGCLITGYGNEALFYVVYRIYRKFAEDYTE